MGTRFILGSTVPSGSGSTKVPQGLAAMLLMALPLASTFPSAQADSGIASSITDTRPHRRLAQGCTTPLAITGTGSSVCNSASAPATTTVTFTSITSATSLSSITVTASQGVVCNSGTGTAAANPDGTFVFFSEFVCNKPAAGWPGGGFSVTMTASATAGCTTQASATAIVPNATPLTITGAGGSVCNTANGGPATTSVTFTSTTSATSLSNITVTASQGVTCNSGTGTAAANPDGTFVFFSEFVCNKPAAASGWPAGGFSVTMTAMATSTQGCSSWASATAAVTVLTPPDTVSITSLQDKPSVCVKEYGADDASKVLLFSVSSSSGSPLNITGVANLLCDGTAEAGSRCSISPSGAPTNNLPSGSIVAVNCSRGVDWPFFEGCGQSFNPVLSVRSGPEVVPGSGCFASATGGVVVPVTAAGPTQLTVSAQQAQQPVCADAGVAIVTWQATTNRGSGNGGERDQLLLTNVSLLLAALPGVTSVPYNASGPASTVWTPVTLLENTAENGYKPLTYQARCTPTGSWPDTTQVNLTATQYNTCGQTNLVTATNTTTLARTDPPTLTVTGPNTASVCSSAAGLQLSYTVTSTSSPADSFTATTTGSSAACLAAPSGANTVAVTCSPNTTWPTSGSFIVRLAATAGAPECATTSTSSGTTVTVTPAATVAIRALDTPVFCTTATSRALRYTFTSSLGSRVAVTAASSTPGVTCSSSANNAVASGSTVTVTTSTASGPLPSNVSVAITGSTTANGCTSSSVVTTSLSSVCCRNSYASVRAPLGGTAATSSCLGCTTATSTGVSLNVFTSLSTTTATAYDLLQGATSTCTGGTRVGSISVQCVTSGSVATVTLGPLNQTLAAAATPSFYLGCAAPSGNRRCSSPNWSGGNNCRVTSATTNCGGALTVDSLTAVSGAGTGTQTYQLGCPCTSVNWLVYVASSGLVVDPVNGVCTP